MRRAQEEFHHAAPHLYGLRHKSEAGVNDQIADLTSLIHTGSLVDAARVAQHGNAYYYHLSKHLGDAANEDTTFVVLGIPRAARGRLLPEWNGVQIIARPSRTSRSREGA